MTTQRPGGPVVDASSDPLEPTDVTTSTSRPQLVDLAIVVGLAVLFTGIFVVLREPPSIYDPSEYFHSATRLDTLLPHHRTLRIGLLFPVRAAQLVFGYSQAAYYAIPLASGVTLLGSTYVLGRVLFGRTVAVAAAVLVVTNSLTFADIHQVWPDLPATALFTAAIATLVWLGARIGRPGTPIATVQVNAVLVSVGLLLGWSYLVREFMAFLFPVVLLVFWACRIPYRRLLPVAAAALAVFGAETIYNAQRFGDPLIRVDQLLGIGQEDKPDHVLDLIESRQQRRGSDLRRTGVLPRLIVRSRGGWALSALLTFGFVAPFASRRRRSVAMLGGWVLTYWTFVTVLSVNENANGGALNTLNERYWFPLLPPLLILALAGLVAVVERTARRFSVPRIGVVVAAALAAVAVVVPTVIVLGPQLAVVGRGDASHEYEELRRWLATDEAARYDQIWTTQHTAWVVRMFVNSPFGDPVWEGRVSGANNARRFRSQDVVSDGLYVVSDSFFEPRRSNWREVTPDYLVDQPDDWALLAATDGSQLVVYDATGATTADEAEVDVAAGWAVRPRPADAALAAQQGGPTASATLAAGQRAQVTRSLADGVTLDTGDVLRLEFPLDASGDGTVLPFCFMRDASGRQVRVDASSMWGIGIDDPPPATESTCAVPNSLEPPVTAFVAVTVVGPVEVSVGGLEAHVVSTDSSWRD